MWVILHPKVHADADAIMEDYERVASRELAGNFYAELRRFIVEAAGRPESFSIRERDLLQSFPLTPQKHFVVTAGISCAWWFS